MKSEEEKIEQEFREVLETLNDNEFWAYVRSWYDEQHILDIMNDWDTETKKIAIKEMNKIRKKSRGY